MDAVMTAPLRMNELATEIGDARPPIDLEVDQQEDSGWTSLRFSLLPMIILFGLFLFVLNSMQGGGSRRHPRR